MLETEASRPSMNMGEILNRLVHADGPSRVCGYGPQSIHHSGDLAPAAAERWEVEHGARVHAHRMHLQQLEYAITELAAHLDAAMYRWLELLREFDEAEGWCGNGIRSLAHWLNWKCGLRLSTARERVRVAKALKELPRTSAAFREGRVSYSKVRAITRAATALNEDIFLNIAVHGTASHVEQAVYIWRREQRLEALQKDNRRHALRELNWFIDEDGCFVLKARFTPDQGAVVRQAIDSVVEEMRAESRNVPAEASEQESPSSLEPHAHPISSQRADAFTRIAEAWLSGSALVAAASDDSSNIADDVASTVHEHHPESDPESIPTLNRTHRQGGVTNPASCFVINLHTDIETLKVNGAGAESELESFGRVSAETSRRLACDAGLIHWLNRGKDGKPGIEPLSVGRKTRTVPPSIRRALQRRDRGCRFPGCTCTRFVDAHHIHHWADGGATHIDNLVLLCRHHHRLVHEGGFGLNRTMEGELLFTDPDGKRLPAAFGPRFRGNVLTLVTQNQENGIEIAPKTPIPEWHGEAMDSWTLAEALHFRESRL